jgi:GT2 family glycosyltransferase
MTCLAILVNYHCAQLIVDAVKSIADDSECDWIHVVDNSESEVEAEWLIQNLHPKAKLFVSKKNIGFGRACNLALEGVQASTILLLNPDARLLPGALGRLKKTLDEHDKVGAVGPRVFWDNEERFYMPPSTYPSRFSFCIDLLGQRWPWLAVLKAKKFRRKSIHYWTTDQAIPVSALSGGHVLLRHTALVSVGGLFDSQFFMYWEDSDLMRRLHDKGWGLLMDPRAKAIHWYEHSASKDRLIGQGWPAFSDKHFSSWFWRKLTQFVQAGRKSVDPDSFTVLESPNAAGFELKVPQAIQSTWLLEISPSRDFIPSIGLFGTGPIAFLPIDLAERLKDRDYHLRLGKANDKDQSQECIKFVFNTKP